MGSYILVCAVGYFGGYAAGSHPHTTYNPDTAQRYASRGFARRVADRLADETGTVWRVERLSADPAEPQAYPVW